MAGQEEHGRTAWVNLIVAAVAVVILLVVVFQNSQMVTFELLFWDIESRLIWMLLLVAGLGFLAGLLLPRFRS